MNFIDMKLEVICIGLIVIVVLFSANTTFITTIQFPELFDCVVNKADKLCSLQAYFFISLAHNNGPNQNVVQKI